MANITTSEVGDSLATIIAAEALGRLRSNSVLSRLVARDWDNEVASYGQIVKIPFRGSLSVNDKAANTNYTLQTPDDSAVSVTLNKHKEVSFVIEDIAKALAAEDAAVLAPFLQALLADEVKVAGGRAYVVQGGKARLAGTPTEATV